MIPKHFGDGPTQGIGDAEELHGRRISVLDLAGRIRNQNTIRELIQHCRQTVPLGLQLRHLVCAVIDDQAEGAGQARQFTG
jgi:hypothetical protein